MPHSRRLGELAFQKAEALCAGLDIVGAQRLELKETLALLGAGWFAQPVGDSAPWPNDLTDDGTPFELSVALSPSGIEPRVLAEPQQAPYGTRSNWLAGLEVHAQLRARGVALARFDAIAWLFEPASGTSARFAIWHAVAVDPDGRSKFKVYLNPQMRGKEYAPAITHRALRLLGLESAWTFLEQRLEQAPDAEILYFSLDLDAWPSARVKVYLAQPHADVDGLERALLNTADYVPGEVSKWVHSLTRSAGPFGARPMLVCYAFDGLDPRSRAALHVPVRSYNASDAEVVERMSGWLTEGQAARLSAALPKLSGRSLEAGRGLITYVSFQSRRDDVRVTAYLAPQAYSVATPRPSLMPVSGSINVAPAHTMLAMEDAIDREKLALSDHPFLRRLATASLYELRAMAEGLTFWVLCFQDVLRLGAKLMTDPRLVGLARTHAEEDTGHEQWFLNDIQRLGAARDLRWVFSREHALARDVSYSLVSEVLAARDDRARLAVLLSLDAIGGQFFGLVVSRLEQLGHSEGLQYFARSHQEIEEGHDIFTGDAHEQLMSVELSAEELVEVTGAVRRTFEALRTLADDLDGRMSSVPHLAAVAGA
jgi:DMATS type aromatic prenyltransferase